MISTETRSAGASGKIGRQIALPRGVVGVRVIHGPFVHERLDGGAVDAGKNVAGLKGAVYRVHSVDDELVSDKTQHRGQGAVADRRARGQRTPKVGVCVVGFCDQVKESELVGGLVLGESEPGDEIGKDGEPILAGHVAVGRPILNDVPPTKQRE